MPKTVPEVDYSSDAMRDESLGRAVHELCSLETPGGRKLVDAFYAPRCAGQSLEDEDCPPWYWAQLLVKQTIQALRDAGWTVEPPSSVIAPDSEAGPER